MMGCCGRQCSICSSAVTAASAIDDVVRWCARRAAKKILPTAIFVIHRQFYCSPCTLHAVILSSKCDHFIFAYDSRFFITPTQTELLLNNYVRLNDDRNDMLPPSCNERLHPTSIALKTFLRLLFYRAMHIVQSAVLLRWCCLSVCQVCNVEVPWSYGLVRPTSKIITRIIGLGYSLFGALTSSI